MPVSWIADELARSWGTKRRGGTMPICIRERPQSQAGHLQGENLPGLASGPSLALASTGSLSGTEPLRQVAI